MFQKKIKIQYVHHYYTQVSFDIRGYFVGYFTDWFWDLWHRDCSQYQISQNAVIVQSTKNKMTMKMTEYVLRTKYIQKIRCIKIYPFKRGLKSHFLSLGFNDWQCNALQVRFCAWRALNSPLYSIPYCMLENKIRSAETDRTTVYIYSTVHQFLIYSTFVLALSKNTQQLLQGNVTDPVISRVYPP